MGCSSVYKPWSPHDHRHVRGEPDAGQLARPVRRAAWENGPAVRPTPRPRSTPTPSVAFAHRFSAIDARKGDGVRSIGLDVHRDFCEVAIVEAGEVGSAGRIETTPAAVELFAGSLCAADRVALRWAVEVAFYGAIQSPARESAGFVEIQHSEPWQLLLVRGSGAGGRGRTAGSASRQQPSPAMGHGLLLLPQRNSRMGQSSMSRRSSGVAWWASSRESATTASTTIVVPATAISFV
jgi:hypothetical protein